MLNVSIGTIEARFADIIWEMQPVTSTVLWQVAEKELNWKKSTTFTVLKRLCDKGIFNNTKGTVTALVSRDEYHAAQSEKFVEDTFDGSLPAFVAAFTTRKALSHDDVAELRRLIDSYKEG